PVIQKADEALAQDAVHSPLVGERDLILLLLFGLVLLLGERLLRLLDDRDEVARLAGELGVLEEELKFVLRDLLHPLGGLLEAADGVVPREQAVEVVEDLAVALVVLLDLRVGL